MAAKTAKVSVKKSVKPVYPDKWMKKTTVTVKPKSPKKSK